MRARALALSILSSAAVLLVGWQLGTQGQTPTAAESSGPAPSATVPSPPTPTPAAQTPSSTPISSSSSPAVSPDATPAPSATSGTFAGTTARTRYGDVQVQITVQNGTITDIKPLQLTGNDSRSVSINNRAAPVLRQRVLAAQSANVQGVSGATYTSEGYLTSLQSALDQAGL